MHELKRMNDNVIIITILYLIDNVPDTYMTRPLDLLIKI